MLIPDDASSLELFGTNDAALSGRSFAGIDDLTITGNVSAYGLESLTRSRITKLTLAGHSLIDARAIEAISKIETLVELSLDTCNFINDEAVEQLHTAPRLIRLSLRWCYDVGDRSCEVLGAMQIEELHIEGCDHVSDRGLAFLAMSKTLRVLTLPDNASIRDAGLMALSRGTAPLTILHLNDPPNITEIGIASLADLPTIRKISGASGIGHGTQLLFARRNIALI